MGAPTIILIPLIRGALFFGCRLTILPRLFGEAKHASLDLPTDDNNGSGDNDRLPTPVTSNTTSTLRNSLDLKTVRQFITGEAQGSGNPSPSLLSLSPSSLSALTLALSFEESTILFVLVLMEAMGFETATLRSNWKWSLFGVVALAICFIPVGLSILLTYPLFPPSSRSSGSGVKRIAVALLPFVAWLILFLKVPLPTALATVQSTLLQSGLARTAVVGVTLIALLSGSGAMGAVMDSIEALKSKRSPSREPSASDLRSAQSSFQKACEDLDRTKREVERLQSLPSSNDSNAGSSWFSSIDRAVRGTPKDREIKALQLEISSLSMLASAMRDELDTLKYRKREAQWRATFSGRIWIAIGHAFAAYCVMRLAVSLFSLLLLNYSTSSSSSSPDLISTLVAKLLHALFSVDIDVSVWSKQISLLFLGVLILGRLRVILNYLAQFFRAASAGVSTSFLILFLAEVMTIYMLATLIQLRTSLPPSFASVPGGDGTATSTAQTSQEAELPHQQPLLASLPDFNIVFGSLFDATFLLSATATLLVRLFWARQENESILFGSSSMRD